MKNKVFGLIFLLNFIFIAICFYYKATSVVILMIPVFLIITLLVLGSVFIRLNLYVKSINSVTEFKEYMEIDTEAKNICLTFDDGIHTLNTPLALDILKKNNIKAHFFIIGKNIKNNEAILKRMHEEGHCIGNHSFWHKWDFDLQSPRVMQQEIEDTNKLIKATTGNIPQIFRPPYGVTNPNLAKAIRNTNMLSMGWNLRSLDTVAKTKNELLKKLIRKTKPNAIVLLHERCDITIDVLTEYIDYCLFEGYTFVTLKTSHEV